MWGSTVLAALVASLAAAEMTSLSLVVASFTPFLNVGKLGL